MIRRIALDIICDPIPYFVAVGFLLLLWFGSRPPELP